MAVCKCVCFNVPFAKINERLDAGCSLPEVQRETCFGAKCSMCVPYVIRAAQTHQGVLPVMWADDFKACGIDPGKVGLIEAIVPEPDRVPAGTFTEAAEQAETGGGDASAARKEKEASKASKQDVA